MKNYCETLCPQRDNCQSAVDAAFASSESLRQQHELFTSALQNADEAARLGALAISNGEISAEQHDKFVDPLIADRPDYPAILVSIGKKITDSDQTSVKNKEALNLFEEGMEKCSGPTLGVFRTLQLEMRRKSNNPGKILVSIGKGLQIDKWSTVSPGTLARISEEDRSLTLDAIRDHGRCGNPSVKRKLFRLH